MLFIQVLRKFVKHALISESFPWNLLTLKESQKNISLRSNKVL